MKSLYLLSVLPLLAACNSDPIAPKSAPANVPDAPSLTWTFDTPRPSMISAEVIGKDGSAYNVVRITWNDPTINEDWNALYFTSPTAMPMVLNAPGYPDAGTRVVEMSVLTDYTNVAVGTAWAGAKTLRTPYSDPVAITSGGSVITNTVKGKGRNK